MASTQYTFDTVKPFNLSFNRYQMSDTSYLINSTITNTLSTPFTITGFSAYNIVPDFQETYNSFTEYFFYIVSNRPILLQPSKEYSHSCIIDGNLKEKTPLCSMCIQFRTPGHEEIRLNSSTISIDV